MVDVVQYTYPSTAYIALSTLTRASGPTRPKATTCYDIQCPCFPPPRITEVRDDLLK